LRGLQPGNFPLQSRLTPIGKFAVEFVPTGPNRKRRDSGKMVFDVAGDKSIPLLRRGGGRSRQQRTAGTEKEQDNDRQDQSAQKDATNHGFSPL
jgi:hypothetical protein